VGKDEALIFVGKQTVGGIQQPMKSIIAGVVLIGLGLVLGDSIFLGNFGILSLVFDGLGFFWIGQGIYRIWREKQQQ
jgi:hypothetical protein